MRIPLAVAFDEPLVVAACRDRFAIGEDERGGESVAERVTHASAPATAYGAEVAAEVYEQSVEGEVGGERAYGGIHGETLGDRAEVEVAEVSSGAEPEFAQPRAHARVEGVAGRRREVERRLIAGARLCRGARKGGCITRAREAAQFGIGIPGGEQRVQAHVGLLHRFADGVLRRRITAAEREACDGAHDWPFDAARRRPRVGAREQKRQADGERADGNDNDKAANTHGG